MGVRYAPSHHRMGCARPVRARSDHARTSVHIASAAGLSLGRTLRSDSPRCAREHLHLTRRLVDRVSGSANENVKAPALLRTIWMLGGLALVLGFGRDAILRLIPQPRELPRENSGSQEKWVSDGFIPPADQFLAPGRLPAHIQKVSSWVGTDEWQGRAETAWFKATRSVIHVGIAGYPNATGCKVWAEFRDA